MLQTSRGPLGPQLRLFTPDVLNGGTASSSWTLSQVFEGRFVPVKLCRASAQTVGEYRCSIAWWRTFTGDPPLSQLSDETTAAFAGLLATAVIGKRRPKPMAVMTQRKHSKQINAVLKFCGPRKFREPNLGLLAAPPWITEPAVVHRPKAIFSIEEVRSLVRAAERMRCPEIGAPAWWRSLVATAYYTGLRMGTLLDLEWTMLQSEVLVIPPEAIKGRKKGEVKFLPPVLRDCLADSRPPTAGRLWPWPHCPRHFQTCWGRLRAAAACRPIGFHGLRRAHLSLTRRLSAIDHGNRIAQVAAGHSDVQTTLSFYLDPEDEFELLKAAVLRMPSPFPETLIAAPAPMEGPHEDHDRVDPANP